VVRPGDESGSGRGSDGHGELSPRSFAAFYRHYYPRLLKFFVNRTHDGEHARDLTEETFGIAFEKRERFRGGTESEAAGWLFVIARVQLLQLYRRGKVERTAFERLEFYQPPATEDETRRIEELIDAQGAKEALAQAMDELPPQELLVVYRHVLQERSYAEIAHELGMTEAAVRMRYFRARRRMKRNADLRKLVEGGHDG
jgi:RNA polymerase sigma-70 factor (ECF subfamily)